MKKTLIALAALAAGTSFAQSSVTLSGSYIGGYEITNAAGSASTQAGLFTDTAAIRLTAVEDLGGGLKATAVVTAANMARSANKVNGEDAFVQLDGSFGTVKLATMESPNDLTPAWIAPGAYGLDGKVYGANVTLDTIGWTSTDMNGFKVSAGWSDYSGTAATAGAGGTIGAANAASQPSGAVGVSYANGPLSAAVTYVSYTTPANNANAAESKIKASAAYDLGVAKLAAAYYTKKFDGISNESGYSFGVAAPVSANLSVGAQYGKFSPKANAADVTGYSLGAQYNLSKRTNISTSYASWKTKGADESSTAFRVLVGHSF